MDSPIIILAFLSLFHVLGGGAIGMAFRDIRLGNKGCRDSFFFIVWGSMFGGIPLFFGISAPTLFPIQVLILLVSFFATFFFWDQIKDILGKTAIMTMIVGGVFFVVGCAAVGFLVKTGDLIMAILFGLVFGGLGGVLVYIGFRKSQEPPNDQEDE